MIDGYAPVWFYRTKHALFTRKFQGRSSKVEQLAPTLVLKRKEGKFSERQRSRSCVVSVLLLFRWKIHDLSVLQQPFPAVIGSHPDTSVGSETLSSMIISLNLWSPPPPNPTHRYPHGSVGRQRSITVERFWASQCSSVTEPVLMFPLHLFPWRRRLLRIFFLPSASPQ